MNFYKRYIGDYLRDTLRLSMIQDGAYGRLIDVYYAEEKPLPLKKEELYQIARATNKAEREAVDTVIGRFFIETPEGYRHKRIEEEIGKAKTKAEANQLNGKKGGRPRKDESHG
ncbi:MAG: YdaU family protein [Paraburkholderia tropica]|nr:YdaU family protein [Paraburkholderia tropica]